jgi:Flp pilus assembly protein TadD
LFLLLGALILSLAGCSQEAKKERHWGRAEKYFSKNQYKEAIIEYRNVLQISPNDAKARYKLGLSHFRIGQLREARAEFERSVEIDLGMVDARL